MNKKVSDMSLQLVPRRGIQAGTSLNCHATRWSDG